MYTFIIYYIYKICLLIKFAPDPFSILPTSIYTNLPLSIPICRPWTSLDNTVFTQIVFSYNYKRLILSISTPFCLPNMYALFVLIFVLLFLLLFLRPSFFTPLLLTPSIHTPSFLPLYLCPLYLYALFVLIFVRLYSYSLFYHSLSSYSLLLSPLYVHIICTPFSQNIFPKKISTPKAYPKIFTYYNYSSPLLFNRKVNSSYSFYKILNTKFWRLYETIKTNGKNYYNFRGTKNPLLSECVLSRLSVSFGVPITVEAEAYLARVCRFS